MMRHDIGALKEHALARHTDPRPLMEMDLRASADPPGTGAAADAVGALYVG